MENVQRIDGEKYHLNRLSDDELMNMRGYALDRLHDAHLDIATLEQELVLRRPIGQLALAYTAEELSRVDL